MEDARERYRFAITSRADAELVLSALYLPFLLDGVAGNARFNQADGIHPNAEGSARVAENVWRVLEPVLDSIANR